MTELVVAMMRTKLFLFLVVGVAGIVFVLEMGFDNWLTSDGALPRGPMSDGPRETDLPPPKLDLSTPPVPSSAAISLPLTTTAKSASRTPSSASEDIPLPDPVKEMNDRLQQIARQHGFGGKPLHSLRSAIHPIQGMPVVSSKSVVRVLVATYFRAGSTFLGDILQQNWKTFYHFEPLHYMSVALRINDSQEQEALSVLSSLFRCDFTSITHYVKWASAKRRQFLFRRNRFLWASCRMRPTTCFSPVYDSAVCRRATVQVMKATRLTLRQVRQLVQANPDLDIRVVHLVRDPRGMISSRRVLDWCNKTSCTEPRELCQGMLEDLETLSQVQNESPDRYVQLRYEDLALNATGEVKELYSKLGLDYTPVVERFIRSHTHARKAEGNNPYSTRRNSSVVAFEWRHRLDYEEIESIQKECSEVIERLGYKMIRSPSDLDGIVPMVIRSESHRG